MAIFVSDLMKDGALPVQGSNTGLGSVTARVFIPAGTTLTDGDFIRIARLETQLPLQALVIRASDLDGGGSPALTASLGYERAVKNPRKAYNASTNPYITGTSVGDDTDYFIASGAAPLQAGGVFRVEAGQSGLANEFANSGVITGTVDLVYEITATANGASAADGYIDVTLEYSGKLGTPGEFNSNNPYNYENETANV